MKVAQAGPGVPAYWGRVRVKAEYWPDYGITSASTFTSIQVKIETCIISI